MQQSQSEIKMKRKEDTIHIQKNERNLCESEWERKRNIFVCFCHDEPTANSKSFFFQQQEAAKFSLYFSNTMQHTNEIQHSIPFRSCVIKQATSLTLIHSISVSVSLSLSLALALCRFAFAPAPSTVLSCNTWIKTQGMHTPHISPMWNISLCARLGVSTMSSSSSSSSLLPRHGSQRNLSHSVAYAIESVYFASFIYPLSLPLLDSLGFGKATLLPSTGMFLFISFVSRFVKQFSTLFE